MDSVLKQLLEGPMRREMTIGKIDAEKRTVELAFSSDVSLERWKGVAEKLDHSPGACDLSRLNNRASLLFNHDEDELLGVVESASIDADGMGRAVVRFSKSEDAEEAWQDVQDGILTKVSVGYRILEVKLTEESESGPDVYTVTRWQPYEISLVTIPADDSCGVGRTLTVGQPNQNSMSDKNAPTTEPSKASAVAPVEPQINIEAERSAARQGELQRVRDIHEAGKAYGFEEIAQRAIVEGKSLDETRQLFLEENKKRNHKVLDASSPIGLSDKEVRNFSFVKLLRSLSDPSDSGARKEAAFELEACGAAAEKIQHRAVKGTIIPMDVLTQTLGGSRGVSSDVMAQVAAMSGQRGTNTISIASGAGYTGTGGNTVATQLLASSFIDVLRNKTVLLQLGTELGGLVGNIDIPRKTTKTSGYWIGEDGNATKDDFDFGLVSLRPKTCANMGEITRKMLMHSSLSVEALLRADLAAGLALEIDRAGFYGNGTANAPTGLANIAGINTQNFATANAPTFAELVNMETLTAIGNADVENMAYIASPGFRGYAKQTKKFNGSTDTMTIWEPGNTVNGYQTQITNQITVGDVFFGNFSDVLVGLFGGLEITVDPYTGSQSGRIRVVSMQDVDVQLRRAVSLTYGKKTS
jgi:HK97 family phage major capsid protein/HK97 family phage prohead protease